MAARRTAALALLATLAASFAACGGDPPVATVARSTDRPFVRSVPGRAARVWAVGDMDANANGRAVVARIARGRPDRVLYLGDVYERGTPAQFRRWGRVWRPLTKRTAPTPGNHDWGNGRDGYDPFWRRVHGVRPPSAYAFTAGGWQILSLNSQATIDEGSRQERWLRRAVRARRGTCRIAFWHRPRYSAGRHGDQDDVAPLWRALTGHASIVLSGHDHDSQRLAPRDGLTQFVAGSGGRDLYDVDHRDARIRFADDRRYAALRLDLRPGRAAYAFVATDGTVLDRGTIRCTRLRR